MSSYTLVVHWKLPDDTSAEDALKKLATKIHNDGPAAPEQVTVYTGISADIIAQAADVGAVVEQAERLALKPGDVVTVRLDRAVGDISDDDFAAYCEALQTAFPDNKIVVLERETTITAAPADKDGAS